MSQRPVMAATLVGRNSELNLLRQHVSDTLRGTGSTVLLGGEAGIGKSRLIRELKRHFEHERDSSNTSGRILTGQCYETDRNFPYGPISDLLRLTLASRATEEVQAVLGSDAAEFVTLLPELATVVSDSTKRPVLDSQQEKQRLFQVLLRFFIRLANDAPLLVVIEDLHWSDDTSLEFLLHLARRLDDLPLLLILSYRNDEIHPDLLRALATLDRERLATDVKLDRLSPGDVDHMLRVIFNQPQAIQPDFLATVYSLTDGNPFFIEEVLRALITTGDIFQTGGRWDRKDLSQLQIPRSIQDAVTRRTDRLSPEAREVLRLAAVAGRVFDFAALEALTRYSEPELLAHIRDMIDAQLVEEVSADRFAFRHALTRQAVYSQLLARERRTLHLAIGETLEQLSSNMPEPYLADLAYHFAAAEDWSRALEYARRAGAHAARLFTQRAAVEQFSRALDAAARLGESPPPDLLASRANAYATLGSFDLADHDRQTVLEMARAVGDREAEWRALLELGQLWTGMDYVRAGNYLNQALVLARQLNAPRLIAESLSQFGGWLINREQPGKAEELLEDALRIYTELGDQHGVARTVDLLGTAADIGGDMARMHQRCQQAAALFRTLDDRHGLSSTLATACIRRGALGVVDSVVTIARVSLAELRSEADEALSLARSIDWRAGESYAELITGFICGSAGRYAEAFAHGDTALALADEIQHQEWLTGSHYMLGSLCLDLLAFDRARSHLEQAARLGREVGSLHWLHLTSGGIADLATSVGDLEESRSILAKIAPDLPVSTIAQRRVWLARARLALADGDAPGALDILDRLFAGAANFTEPAEIPALALLRGTTLQLLERYDLALESLSAARIGAAEREMKGLLWRVDLGRSQLYDALGQPAERDAAVESARRLIEEIVVDLPDEDLRTAFRDGAASPIARVRADETVDPFRPLTSRERDVALLLTRGLSNREIAERLFVGERTIETHVGNILAKLGFRSRTQIATWAVEHGLAEPTVPST